jgi:serine/threonine-protein kinase RsbW
MASEDYPAQQSDSVTTGVVLGNLADARRRARDTAQRAGLIDDRAAQFAVAVNEAVINAVEHGRGTAILTLAVEPDRVIAEVYDQGPGTAAQIPVTSPAPDQLRGRGLWLARQFCDQVEIVPSNEGTLTRLTIRKGDPADADP